MKFFDADSASDMDALDQRRSRRIAREERKVSAGRWTIYPYYNEHGEKVFEKCRIPLGDGKKTFRQRHFAPTEPHGYKWDYHRPREGDRLLYNLPDLLRAKASGADVWWTEGEKDAGRLEEELTGDDCAVSHIDGAGNSTPEQAEWFRGDLGRVFLAMDLDEDDEHGRNPGVFCVIRRFDQLRAVGLKLSQLFVVAPAVGKDIFDHLAAGLTLDDLVFITDLGPLREKAERGKGFGAWGYRDHSETAEEIGRLLAERGGWFPVVSRG